MKADDEFAMASGNLPRDLTVLSRPSENAVWVWHLDAGFNDRFGDMQCATPKTLPHAPKNAASAKLIIPRTGLSREFPIRGPQDFATAANGGYVGCDRSIASPGWRSALGRPRRPSRRSAYDCCDRSSGREEPTLINAAMSIKDREMLFADIQRSRG